MKTAVVCAGPADPGFIRAFLTENPQDFLIAADRGLDTLAGAGFVPDLILGDYDSVSSESFVESYKRAGAGIRRFPVQKDFTDAEAALKEAVARKSTEITVLGATGGRLDHFLSVMNSLILPLKAGIPACIRDEQNVIFLADRPFKISADHMFGKYISLIPYTDTVTDVRLDGFLYPLDGEVLRKDNSLGISNELAGDTAHVSFTEGVLTVIFSKDGENNNHNS
ncbi:MAG TPA: thiamine diphosphokinase [Lachnospiraceae bacterium]|nr:thiamine diphosphokinase [Lachnospiraceae bacterium]